MSTDDTQDTQVMAAPPAPDPVATATQPRLHEDAARLVRQRLLALEEGREDDADAPEQFLQEEHGLTIKDVQVADVPQFVERWRSIGMPDSVEMVTVLVNYAKEPVWRIPYDLEDREPSWMETPIHLLPPSSPWLDEDGTPAAQYLPRQTDLPTEIAGAIRPATKY